MHTKKSKEEILDIIMFFQIWEIICTVPLIFVF